MALCLRRRFLTALLITLAFGSTRDTWAQARSKLVGTITDAAGASVPGASVSVRSQNPPGAPLTIVTNERGAYRLPDLTPGIYDLTATQGTETVRRTGLRLPVGTTLTVDLAIGGPASPDSTTANEAGPVVDVTTATSAIIFDREELENLPISNVNNLPQLTPGVTRGVFGGGSDTNQVTIDGSPITFTHRLGNAGVPLHPYWMDQAQIISLGASAGVGEFTGVVTNVALRSGSNRFSGLLEYRTARPQWVADNTDALPEALRAGFRPQRILSRWASDVQAGGPVARDRVFFFAGLSYIRNKLFQAGTIGDIPVDSRQPDVLVRLTAARWRNVRIEGFTHVEHFRSTGSLGRNQLPEAAGDTTGTVSDWNGRLTWTQSARTFVEVRSNGLHFGLDTLPAARRAGPSPHLDRISQILSGNTTRFDDTSARRVLTSGAVRHFLDDFHGSHELEAGFEHDRTNGRTTSGLPGGRSYIDAGGVADQVTLWNGDTIESRGVRTSLYVQDTWRAGSRLTFHPGVRLALNRGSVPDKGTVFKTTPISPRLGLAWDVAANHKTVVRAAYGRFHEGLYPTVFDFLNTSGRTPVITARVLGPDTFQEINRTAIAALAVDEEVAHAYVDDYVAAIEREVLPSVSVKAQYIRREFKNIWAFIDTRSQYAPAQRQDPGPDGRLGTADDGSLIPVFNVLNPGQSFPVLTNPEGAFRRYDAVQVIGEKHTSGNWQLLGAYTWSRTRGSVNNGNGDNRANGGDTNMNGVFFNPNRSINAEGRSVGDCPHQLNLQGTYLMPAWGGITLSGGYRYLSGPAWGRTAIITGLAQGNQPVRIEPRGTRRLDAISQIDLRLEKTFPIGGSRSVGIYADVFNVTNQGVPLAAQEASGTAFGQPLQWSAPRTMQAAVRVKF